MRTSLKPTFESTVLQPEMRSLMETGEARRLWNEHQSGVHDHSRKLWSLLMIACWWGSVRESNLQETLAAGIAGKSAQA